MIETIYSDPNYLQHYGVKGMKWGVRRYQNFDGSYTQAGLKRFNSSLETYESANDRYKSAKKNKASKTEVTNARLSRKKAKNRLEKDYRHLKQDKLGDKGKDLYSRGKTITTNSQITQALTTAGTVALSAAAYNKTYHMLGDEKVTKILAASGATLVGAATIKEVSDRNQAKKLRAYYTHTSNY